MRILIALFTLLCSSNVAALTCFVPPIEARYREHDHVALVEVTSAQVEESEGFLRSDPFEQVDSIEISEERTPRAPAWRKVVATIRVLESYRKTSPPECLVLTSWGNSPEITVGAMYVVFLNTPDVSMDCNGMPMVSTSNPEDARLIGELKALKARKETTVP